MSTGLWAKCLGPLPRNGSHLRSDSTRVSDQGYRDGQADSTTQFEPRCKDRAGAASGRSDDLSASLPAGTHRAAAGRLLLVAGDGPAVGGERSVGAEVIAALRIARFAGSRRQTKPRQKSVHPGRHRQEDPRGGQAGPSRLPALEHRLCGDYRRRVLGHGFACLVRTQAEAAAHADFQCVLEPVM